MYEDFYHLSSNPFRLAPDPKFRFSHPSYDEANAYLEYALKLGEGFVIFTGRPGTGKTTLIHTFLGSLEATEVVAARIAVPNLNAADLLRAVAYAYEVDAEGLDMASVLRRLERFFLQQVRAGKRILLIVDEAQGLSPNALEELRLLADMQTESRFLLQIFLVGQETLRELMVAPEMEQFQQRVTGTCKLKPLSLQETRDYVEYRLCQVGWSGDPELTGPAVHAIYQYSDGIPRHINKVCTRLLLLQGLMGNKHILDESDVLEVARGLKDEQLAPLQPKQSVLGAVSGVGVMVETVTPTVAFDELALRAPTDTVKEHSSTPVKHHHRASVGRNTREARVSEQRVPLRKSEKNNTLWLSTGTDLYLQGKRKILALTGRARQLFEVAVVISGLTVITLLVVLLVPVGDNPDGDSKLLTSREDAHETWIQTSRFRDGIYEEYPVYKEPGFVHENHDRRSAMAAQETKEIPAEHYKSVDAQALEPGIIKPVVMRVAPIAENTVATDVSRSDSDDADGKAASLAFLAFPVVDEPYPGTTRVDTQDTVAENHNPEDTLVPADVSVGVMEKVWSDPEQVIATHSREDEVARLLSLAAESLREDRLLIPSDNNAYAYYRQVEALDRENNTAATGMDRIAERYVVLAERAIDRDDTKTASRYIERGLYVRAANTDLLALQTAVLLASTPEVRRSFPPPAVQESPVEPHTLLSMLKKVFNNNQSRTVDPSIWHDDEETW